MKKFSSQKIEKFKKLSKAKQIEYMRNWFSERYEDPAQHTPYESAEGGYLWIYGGPFDAFDVLSDEFGDYSKRGAIEELSDELSDECSHWTRTTEYDRELYPPDDDYDLNLDLNTAEYEIIVNLESNLDSLEHLAKKWKIKEPKPKGFSEMMIFSFAITALETYLSDIFVRIVMKNEIYKEKYLKSDKTLSARRFGFGELFNELKEIDNTIKKRISETSFHNLGQVKNLFHAVIGIDIGDIEELIKLIAKRHDFVHRGGKDPSGKLVYTDKKEVLNLIKRVRSFCKSINKDLESQKLIESAPF